MKELEMLLERYWITKEEDKEAYYSIKDASPKFKSFLEDKLGYKLVVNPYMIKLEKLPGKAESWMGIQEFEDGMEYAFLCLLLTFLEDRGDGEQFVLSEVTEFIQAAFPANEKVDWTLFRHRKAMVKVLRFAVKMSLIRVDDGDEVRFMDTMETEVLYESTGLSRYFVRVFSGNILNYSTASDIENGEWLDLDRDRGRVRRNRVYRRLFMSPAVYSEGADDEDYLYIKNYRNILQKDIEDILGSQLHVHKNGAFLVLAPDRHFRDVFPDSKGISDIVLQLNGLVVDKVREKEFFRRDDDIVIVSKTQFEKLIESCRELYMKGWSKEYREMAVSRLYDDVMGFMKGFNMIEADELGKEIRIMPIVGKVTGSYPKGYGEEVAG